MKFASCSNIVVPSGHWLSQPQIKVGLNPANLFLKAMEAEVCLLPSIDERDMVRGSIPTNGGTLATANSSIGRGEGYAVDTNGYLEFTGRTAASALGNTCAMVFVRTATVGAGSNNFAYYFLFSNNLNLGFCNTTAYNVGTQNSQFYDANAQGVPTNITIGVPYMLIASTEAKGASSAWYNKIINLQTGAMVSNQSGTATVNPTGTSSWKMLGGSNVFGKAFPGDLYLGVMGSRYLPPQLADQWLRNPWQVFDSTPLDIVFPTPVFTFNANSDSTEVITTPWMSQPWGNGTLVPPSKISGTNLTLVDAALGNNTRSVKNVAASVVIPRKEGLAGKGFNPVTTSGSIALPRPPSGYYDNTTCLAVFTINALPTTRAACGGFSFGVAGAEWPASLVIIGADGNLHIGHINNSGLVTTSLGTCVLGKLYAVAWTKPLGTTPVARCSVNGAAPINVPISSGGTQGADNGPYVMKLALSAAGGSYVSFDNLNGNIFLNSVFVPCASDKVLQGLTADPFTSPWQIFDSSALSVPLPKVSPVSVGMWDTVSTSQSEMSSQLNPLYGIKGMYAVSKDGLVSLANGRKVVPVSIQNTPVQVLTGAGTGQKFGSGDGWYTSDNSDFRFGATQKFTMFFYGILVSRSHSDFLFGDTTVSASSDYNWGIYWSGSGINCYVKTSSGVAPVAGAAPLDDKPHLVVATYDGGVVRTYLDGIPGATAPQTGNIQQANYNMTMNAWQIAASLDYTFLFGGAAPVVWSPTLITQLAANPWQIFEGEQ
jgi:hypothetical protein